MNSYTLYNKMYGNVRRSYHQVVKLYEVGKLTDAEYIGLLMEHLTSLVNLRKNQIIHHPEDIFLGEWQFTISAIKNQIDQKGGMQKALETVSEEVYDETFNL